MPLPTIPDGGWQTRTQMVEAYAELDWYKDITFEWVEVNQRRGVVEIKKYQFLADTIGCGNVRCDRYLPTFVQLVPHGVVITCAQCRKTMGVLSTDDAILLDQRVAMSLEEINIVLRKTGQVPPVGFDRMFQGARDGGRVPLPI